MLEDTGDRVLGVSMVVDVPCMTIWKSGPSAFRVLSSTPRFLVRLGFGVLKTLRVSSDDEARAASTAWQTKSGMAT